MEVVCIPHGQTPSGANRLFLDLLSHYDRVQRFYRHPPTLDAVEESARSLSYPTDRRERLVRALKAQNQTADASVQASLNKLAQPDAVAIVSGQQTGFLGGPAYAVYKALTAIRWAQELEKRGVPAVPVFWMATEDHDLDEVSSAWILDRQGSPLKLQAVSTAGAGGPAGLATLEPAPVDAIEDSVFGLDWADETVELVRSSYGQATTFGAGFQALFQKIFEGARFPPRSILPPRRSLRLFVSPPAPLLP